MNGTPSLAPGQVEFFDNCLPALEAGPYTLTVTPTLKDPTGGHAFPAFAPITQPVAVTAPHYTLDPAIVFSQFPPPNASSDFGQYLPQVVLTHPNLPWVRLIEPDYKTRKRPSDPANPPWLALLLFQPGEIGETGKSGTLAKSGAVGTVLNAANWPAGYAKPTVGLDPLVDPTSPCQYIDLPARLFSTIAPKLVELPYLAHYRQVDTAAGGVGGDSESGAYAAVICNRVPAGGASPVPWVAHLVSLEGYVDCLPDAATPQSFQTIRLVSLASWTFSSAAVKQFSAYMTGLSLDMLRLPAPAHAPTHPTKAEQAVLAARLDGHVPVTYAPRQGERTAAWYRGPLSAAAIAHATAWAPHFATSDAASVYDAQSGMFDLSYAIAWQIGRLLALADPKFCSALIAFRASAAHALLQHDIRNELAARFPTLLALPQDALDRIAPRAASDAAREYLFEQLPGVLDQLRPLLAGRADRRRVDDRLDRLPGALPQAELAALLARGGDPVHALLRRILPGHAGEED
jgi:hypothetical protein